MKKTTRRVVGLAAAAMFALVARPASAFDWPFLGKSTTCARCGQPMSRSRIFVVQPHGCPAPAIAPVPAVPVAPTAPGEAQPAPYQGQPTPYQGQPGQPPPMLGENAQPGATPPAEGEASTAAPTTDTSAPATASGLGGGLGEMQGALNMFGDAAPLSRLATFRPPPPPESTPTRFPSPYRLNQSAALVPSVRSFKFADNQTPMPVNRLTYSFDYFNNVNAAVNRRFNSPITGLQAYANIFGFEKTFLDGNASFGMRIPLNTLTANSPFPNIGNTTTATGDLTAYFKYALYLDRPKARVISTGMAVTVPSGPTTFGGANYLRGLHYTNLQPYIGAQWTSGDWFAIAFASISVPTNEKDVLMGYNDLAIGYFVYRSSRPNAFLTAVAPNVEVHVNTPFNHRHSFSVTDLVATPEIVDLTQGLNFFLANRAVLSLGVVEPVTGPKPFAIEALALLNLFY
jgi:hypothetical protein